MTEKKHILLPYQQRWVNDKGQLKIWRASRQIGKSFSLSIEAVTEALSIKCDNLILSGSDRQSKEVMRKVLGHLIAFKQIIASDVTEHESKTEIGLKGGSRIISLPANPDTVRGFSGNIFLDEFAFHMDSEEIWKAIYPTTTRGFKVRICSTTNGKQNMFYHLFNTPDNGFSKHTTTIHDAIADGLKVDLDALRKGVSNADTWAQEFECVFIDSITAFLTYEIIQDCEHEAAFIEPVSPDYGRGDGCYLGMDIGRKKNLTVFWVLEKMGDVFWTREIETLQNVSFSSQRKTLFSYLERMGPKKINRACIDSSGLGMQLAEEAREAFGARVEEVGFTGPVKEDMAVTLKRCFEDRRIRIPSDKLIREDLHSVKKEITSAGNSRFSAANTEDGHADRFWALALAAHAGSSPSMPVEYQSVIQRRGSNAGDDADWRAKKGCGMRPYNPDGPLRTKAMKGCY